MSEFTIPISFAQTLKAIVSTTTDMIHLNSSDGRILYCNPCTESILGYTTEELLQRPAAELLHPEDRQRIAEDMQATASGGVPIPREVRLLRKDGSYIDVEVKGFLIDTGDDTACIGAIIRDISQRKQREKELARYQTDLEELIRDRTVSLEEQQRFSAAVIDGLPGIFLLLEEGAFFRVNRNLLDSLGYSIQDLSRSTLLELVAETDREEVEKQINRIPQAGRSHFRCSLLTKDGTTIPFFIAGIPFAVEGKNYIILIGQDTSEVMRLEEELHHKKQLESIGVLAGGMAHDLNNILTVIMGYLDMLEVSPDLEPDKRKRFLASAKTECRKINQLCEGLITFSEGGSPFRKEVDLQSLIRDCVAPLFHKSRTHCSLSLLADIPPQQVDAEQLKTVFTNLCSNALEAMPEGGRFVLSQRLIVLEGDNPYSLPQGNYLCTTFRDNGLGIAHEVLPSIFNPFFTTKPLGAAKGKGLGLAVAHSIIRKHGGAIEVNSTPGQGTAVDIYLPLQR